MVVALLENLKSPIMVDCLLANLKVYGCCLAGQFENPDMVDVLLEHKKSSYG